MKLRTFVWLIIIIVAIVIARIAYGRFDSSPATTATSTAQLIQTVHYACSDNKTITASYFEGESKPAASPGMPPTPGGSVALTLSDGRQMTLPQTISGSGIRYANPDESLVFWSKGNGATITEGSQPTYTCILAVSDPGGLPNVYENGMQGISIRYPEGYTVDSNYKYTQLGESKPIFGVKFTIASSTAAGTNLSGDTYIAVEELPQEQDCTASLFIYPGVKTTSVTENGTTYSVASSTDAGVGNRYEEHVYAIPGTNPCIAVRYFIHYAVFENFPAGTVQRFDEAALLKTFGSIRKTLTID